MKKRKMQSGEVLRELGQHRTADGDERPLPCKSTMNGFCRQMGGTAVLHIRLLIKTPWHARWRLHFAETWLEEVGSSERRMAGTHVGCGNMFIKTQQLPQQRPRSVKLTHSYFQKVTSLVAGVLHTEYSIMSARSA